MSQFWGGGTFDVLGGDATETARALAAETALKTEIIVDDYLAGAANTAAAFEAAFTAAPAGSRVVGRLGATYVFAAGTVPQFPKNKALEFDGKGCTIQLSATVPRAFDFGPGAGGAITAFDTFSGIYVHDFTVDCNNVGGSHHTVIGTYQNSTYQTRINLDHITVRRVKTINVPTTGANRSNVALITAAGFSGEATQLTVTDILIEDVDFRGGAFGVQVAGGHNGVVGSTTVNGAGQTIDTTPRTLTVVSTANFTASTGVIQVAGVTGNVTFTGKTGTTFTGCTVAAGSFTATDTGRASATSHNIFIDRVRVQRVYHDSLRPSPPGGPGAAVDLISWAIGGKDIHVCDIVGIESGDVTVEVDGCEQAVIERVTAINGGDNPFTYTCFNDGLDAAKMTNIWRDCQAFVTHFTNSECFLATNNYGISIGDVVLEDCSVKITENSVHTTAFNSGSAVLFGGTQKVSLQSLSITNFACVVENLNWGGAGAGFYFPISIAPDLSADGSTPKVTIRNVRVSFSGTQSAAGKMSPGLITLGGNAVFDVRGLDFNYAMTNSGGGSLNTALTLLRWANIAGSSTGVVEGIRVRGVVGDTTPTGVTIAGTGTWTPGSGRVTFADLDFSGAPAGITEFSYTANQNKSAVFYGRGITWRGGTKLTSSLTVTASPFTYQNLSGYPELIQLGNDNGPITKVEVANDNATFTDVKNPLAAQLLVNGAAERVTYSGTAPTITKTPVAV